MLSSDRVLIRDGLCNQKMYTVLPVPLRKSGSCEALPSAHSAPQKMNGPPLRLKESRTVLHVPIRARKLQRVHFSVSVRKISDMHRSERVYAVAASALLGIENIRNVSIGASI